LEYSKAYRHLVSGVFAFMFAMYLVPCLGCVCVGLLLRHRAVGWVFTFLVQLCCCDVVCWLQTIPGIVEAGTVFHYLEKSFRFACLGRGVDSLAVCCRGFTRRPSLLQCLDAFVAAGC
jgi:hypothetical protein